MPAPHNHILIVEDDPVTRSMLSGYFVEAGFSVVEAASGDECRAILQRQSADVVLLDIGLPDVDGLKLGQHIREHTSAAIIFVTNRTGDVDRIVGLELAGDDYVTKPVNLRELLARVRSVLRRRESANAARDTLLGFGGWTIDLVRRNLMDASGEPVNLTRGEFDLLGALVTARGRPLTRAYLLEVISNHDADVNERTVDALIVRLRRKLKDSTESSPAIQTLHGVGYKLGLTVDSRR